MAYLSTYTTPASKRNQTANADTSPNSGDRKEKRKVFRRIQFTDPLTKKRQTLYLAFGTSLKTARKILRHVEDLVTAKAAKGSPDDETANWLGEIGDDLHAKLAAVGLVAARSSHPAVVAKAKASELGIYLNALLESRKDTKESTRITMRTIRHRLVKFFGETRQIQTITPADADDFKAWLREHYADATAARSLKQAKAFLRRAVRSNLIASNPFDDVSLTTTANKSRMFFVTREIAAKVLDACPSQQWRLIFAMARFGGIRIPSELAPLTWRDVDWERGRIRITSPKTAHHEGKAERWIPMFPELRAELNAAWELAKEGDTQIVDRCHSDAVNLRKGLTTIIRKAGLTPWPKPFHNCRASRETELAAEYPLHVVCEWIGNSALIAQKHYLQVTDADFQKATGTGNVGATQSATSSVSISAPQSGSPLEAAFAKDREKSTLTDTEGYRGKHLTIITRPEPATLGEDAWEFSYRSRDFGSLPRVLG